MHPVLKNLHYSLIQYDFVHSSVLLIETTDKPLGALKSLTPNLLAVHKAFSFGNEPLITALLALSCLNHAAIRHSICVNGHHFRLFL
jgi:hypothetical protein